MELKPPPQHYTGANEMVPCPECRSWMLPLQEYEVQKTDSPSIDAEWWEFLMHGWMAFVGNYIYDMCTYEGRKRKLATKKETVLPQYPNSLVCPRCVQILQRP